MKDVTFYVPKSFFPNSLIRGTHDESVILHGLSLGTYMEHETNLEYHENLCDGYITMLTLVSTNDLLLLQI